MPEKIKKQIKRSLPWFMVINLIISTMVAGLFFNYNFKLYKTLKDNLELKVEAPLVQADTASTSVKVLNAPPQITTPAAESPSSTSTSPVNVGASISFTITANDSENNDYYLIVCSENSVTASTTGGPPSCGGVGDLFCLSDLTDDTDEASCTYSDVADPGAGIETQAWFAFACDNHSSEGQCTTADPGSGISGSPFYVNHEPTFTAIATTDNNKDPGGTFTITASTTDDDVARGVEVLHLYVCQTNSWATSTGCANLQLCHATSTSPDVNCSFATSSVAVDGNYTYYAFVMDDFYMPAPQNPRNSTYHVNNVTPIVTAVKLQSDNNIEANLKNDVNGEAMASTTSVSISDLNGCTDIVGATGTIFWIGASGYNYCTANYNNCYQIPSSACQIEPGSCSGPSSAVLTITCTTTISFYAVPTDDATGNPNATTNWQSAITVYDETLSNTATSSGVDLVTNTALEVDELEISYGTLQADHDSDTNTATTTIINFGNSPINSYVYGTNMAKGGDIISITEQEHDLLAYFNYGTGTKATSTQPGDLENTDINRPTSQTNVTDFIYWGINIPALTPSGNYYGVNTFTVSLDSSGVGW